MPTTMNHGATTVVFWQGDSLSTARCSRAAGGILICNPAGARLAHFASTSERLDCSLRMSQQSSDERLVASAREAGAYEQGHRTADLPAPPPLSPRSKPSCVRLSLPVPHGCSSPQGCRRRSRAQTSRYADCRREQQPSPWRLTPGGEPDRGNVVRSSRTADLRPGRGSVRFGGWSGPCYPREAATPLIIVLDFCHCVRGLNYRDPSELTGPPCGSPNSR
ncbi:MAG: hypothetical protein JWN96_898 [Mycobacterium sp.]|nr:hypothetical protein [Mycobacterium sp.]